MEGELSKIDQEKTDLVKEREKYLLLNEEERQIEEEKKHLESQRLEIQNLIENLKKNFQNIPGTVIDFSLLSSMQ